MKLYSFRRKIEKEITNYIPDSGFFPSGYKYYCAEQFFQFKLVALKESGNGLELEKFSVPFQCLCI